MNQTQLLRIERRFIEVDQSIAEWNKRIRENDCFSFSDELKCTIRKPALMKIITQLPNSINSGTITLRTSFNP